MPRRKGVRTSRKKAFRARSKGKLFSRRGRTFRRRYVRRSRGIRYRKSRKFIRRYRSSSKFPYMKLVKHSVFLSPSDFLMFPFHDISNLMAAGSYQGTNAGIGRLWTPSYNTDVLSAANNSYNYNWVVEMIKFARGISMCYSTQLINPGYHTLQSLGSSLDNVRLTCFNPPHSAVTGGAYFMLYANIYQFFKFCGLKVKFIPHTVKAATTVPDYTGIIAQGPDHESVNIGYEPSGRWSSIIPIGKMDNNLAEHANEDDVKTVAPPQYRLWVNFDKFSPMSTYLSPWALAGNMSQVNLYATNGSIVLNPNIWEKHCLQTRLKFTKVFNATQNTVDLKSYSMTKPFKFYVRPYDVDYSSEAPVAPVDDETQVRNEALKYIIQGDGDAIQKKPKRQRWIRTPMFVPNDSVGFENGSFYRGNDWSVGSPEVNSNKSSQEMILNNTLLVSNFTDANFYNPPLFNYFVTRDDLEAQEGQNLLGVYENPWNDGATYFKHYAYEGYPNFNQAGKFKLTFYYRFKRPRPEVGMVLPLTQHRDPGRGFNDFSLSSGIDPINYKRHITANDLPANITGFPLQ